jgi:cell fate regulator YaaT (PSP1 superfamily)
MSTNRATQLFVRVGREGAVSACTCAEPAPNRDDEVVVRTSRGLEYGRVLGPARHGTEAVAEIVRKATKQDRLLYERLTRRHADATEACCEQLDASHPELSLLDAEPLFDGRTVLFYFLGEPQADELQSLTDELAECYLQASGLDEFAHLLTEGCGPGCGTKEKACGTSGGCATCVAGCSVSGERLESR